MGDVWGDGKPNERPIHKVTVNSFYMSKYEITHGEYIEFLNSIDISPEGSFKGNELIDIDNSDCAISYNGTSFYFEGSSYADNEQCPVILVSWYGACEYCNWMSEQEGLTKAYIINKESVECNWDASGYRLPTEAEWEYTARSKGRNDRKWSGTNSELELSDYCWYDPDNGNKTHKVGTKKPNDIGIYDLSGNVYEWCWDWHGDYSSSSQNNPKGPASGSYRVLRGGHWYYFAFYLRTSYRHLYSPSFSMVSIGFRIVRSG
jgi:formylglycine-generating enzyme required for sulfatase activity